MREILAHSPMRDGIPFADNRMRLVGESAAVIKGTLDKRPMSLSEAINVFPGACGVEGEFIGGRPHDGAVFFV